MSLEDPLHENTRIWETTNLYPCVIYVTNVLVPAEIPKPKIIRSYLHNLKMSSGVQLPQSLILAGQMHLLFPLSLIPLSG